MEVWEAKRLKALEDDNAKLKKLLAKQMFHGQWPIVTAGVFDHRSRSDDGSIGPAGPWTSRTLSSRASMAGCAMSC